MGHATEQTEIERADERVIVGVRKFIESLPAPIDCHGGYDDTLLTKQMRADLALAVTRGILPAGTKVSVRKNHYRSFSIDIVAWVGPVFVDAYYAHLLDEKTAPWNPGHWDYDANKIHDRGMRHGRDEYPRALNEALYAIDRIINRHNYNNSDAMTDYFDVGYYETVSANTIHGAARTAVRIESDPEYRALLADASIHAQKLGAKCVTSVCGRGGLDRADKHDLKAIIRISERAKGRPVAYDKRRRGWFPVENGMVIDA